MSGKRGHKHCQNTLILCLALLALVVLILLVILLVNINKYLSAPTEPDTLIAEDLPVKKGEASADEAIITHSEGVPELSQHIIVKPEESGEKPQEKSDVTKIYHTKTGGLCLKYNANQVEIIEYGAVYIVQCIGSEENDSQMFLQLVDGTFSALKPEMLKRIAIGLLQACCYSEPTTNQVRVVSYNVSDTEYRAELETDDITAAIRILDGSDGIWCSIVLMSDSADGGLLVDIMNQATVKQE